MKFKKVCTISIMKFELEEEHLYTLDEMKAFFGVTKDQWKKNNNELLKHLCNYYEYEIRYNQTDKRKKEFYIFKKIKDYEDYVKPKSEKIQMRDKIFEEGIIDIVKEDNIQTSANINRIMRRDIKFVSDNYKEGTSYEYVRIRMIDYFGKKKDEGGTKGYIARKMWCKLDIDTLCYIPLSDEMIEEFYNLLGNNLNSDDKKREIAEICSSYENDLITKEERDNELGFSNYMSYEQTKSQFHDKYGFYPVCVPVYKLTAWSMSKENFNIKENE